MKLFISYARVDKPYCVQIINALEFHDVWYDQRLRAGKHWWKEILRRLDWCEGFIYLISPDSIASEYCQKEYKIARDLGRQIIPVVIHPDTDMPDELAKKQYIDFSNGLTVDAVKSLLNAIHQADRELALQSSINPETAVGSSDLEAPGSEIPNPIGLAAAAMEEGAYDRAVFLLKHAKAHGRISKFIKVDVLLAEAEKALEEQTYQRQAEREYRQIAELFKLERTLQLGCEALQAFLEEYPNYDPDQLAEKCPQKVEEEKEAKAVVVDTPTQQNNLITFLPMFEWCDIPAGQLNISSDPDKPELIDVPAFQISKYLITNSQYEVFVDDPEGYKNLDWWNFSAESVSWFEQNPEPSESIFKGDDRPREMVNWYACIAFCNWLSNRTGLKIMLPNDLQWIRAGEGDKGCEYPWGDEFDPECCNTRESGLTMTTRVTRYSEGASPFGVYDMSGNVWEWCLDSQGEGRHLKHLVHGGSYMSTKERATVRFRYYIDPKNYHSSIGFRIVCLSPPSAANHDSSRG
ncbi:MAG: TIR domain-containing protein [Chloroflexi bacterium]|nr:MAG: TIR domain-containing protein [Chloroflexota bacterium]